MNEIPEKLLLPVQALVPKLWETLREWASVERTEVEKEFSFAFILGGVICSFVEYMAKAANIGSLAAWQECMMGFLAYAQSRADPGTFAQLAVMLGAKKFDEVDQRLLEMKAPTNEIQ